MTSTQREEWAVEYPEVVYGPLDRAEAEGLVAFVRSRGAEAHLLRRVLTVHEWEQVDA